MSKERLEVYYRAILHCNVESAILDADDLYAFSTSYPNVRTITFEKERAPDNYYYRQHLDFCNKTATFISSNSVPPIIHPHTFPASWTIRAMGTYVIDRSPGDTGNPLTQ